MSASRFIAILAGLMLDVASAAGAFGAALYHVTTLADSGPGSLRDAVSQGNRTIVFDIGGTITLTTGMVKVKGSSVIIDGFTAPSPGITLANAGVYISGVNGAHDVTVRGIRVRNSSADGITIRDNTYNILVDHVSGQGASDGSIDVTEGAFDVMVQWSIFAENIATHNLLSLIDTKARRITFHHNLFILGGDRNPKSGWDNTLATAPTDCVTNIRNNLIWNYGSYGTRIADHTWSNVVRNFYYSSSQPSAARALKVETTGGQVYAQGNYNHLGTGSIDTQGNVGNPFASPWIATTDACTAAQQVKDNAGARPLDAIDQGYISQVSLPAAPCAGTSPFATYSSILPSSRAVQVGTTATVFGSIINTETAVATGCGVALVSPVSATFSFQSLATTGKLGAPNAPIGIPAGAGQTFLLSLTPQSAFLPQELQLLFACDNAGPSPVLVGGDTWLLSASYTPIPDIIAGAVTTAGGSLVDIPGPHGANFIPVSTMNVGAAETITAQANTRGVPLPVTLTICQTNPMTGACINPSTYSPSATTTIAARETDTFTVLVQASGTIPLDLAHNRIFIVFKDRAGIIRGRTSVAVRTQ